MCLQETLIGNRQAFPPSQYDISISNQVRADGRERGAAILINKHIRHSMINLRTDLQATAVQLFMNKHYPVCSIYLPHAEVTYDQLSNLIDQLHNGRYEC